MFWQKMIIAVESAKRHIQDWCRSYSVEYLLNFYAGNKGKEIARDKSSDFEQSLGVLRFYDFESFLFMNSHMDLHSTVFSICFRNKSFP